MKIQNRIIASICLFFIFLINSTAQQTPLSPTQRMTKPYFNPAYTSPNFIINPNSQLSVGLMSRLQWKNGPQMHYLRADYQPEYFGDGLFNIGFDAMHYNTSPINTTQGRLSLRVNKRANSWGIAGGISGGYINYGINVTPEMYSDFGDPIIDNAITSQHRLNLGFGVLTYYYLPDKNQKTESKNYLAFGISSPQVFDYGFYKRTDENEYPVQLNRHFYYMTEFATDISTTQRIEVSAWLQTVKNIKPLLTTSARFFQAVGNYRDEKNIWLGVGFSASQTLHFELGHNFGYDTKYLRISMAVELSAAEVKSVFGNSYSLMMSMEI